VYRILLVDDDADVLSFMRDALQDRGYDLWVLQSGVQAVAILQRETFDLIITDIVMPKVHGLEILESAKRRDPLARVVFVTGHPFRDVVREGFEKGAFSVLEKPFLVDHLLETVDQALRGAA
jgi:two-component system, NtrC family, response regulator HydG